MDNYVEKGSAGSTGAHFRSLEHLFEALGVTRPIHRLLISNNGLAAVKGIDSIRSWLYDHLGDSEAVQFVVMATPEDLKSNAEFISMADQHVPVPGGMNRNNYANVDLIMHTALQNTCDAIYPGWGHASENPELPRECEKSKRVTFLGPSKDAMFILGDKIASTIVAQSNGVPTVPWSGSEIQLPPGEYELDPGVYGRAYVTTPEGCEAVCRAIGFPVMIKASEGGGGKGIRCCTSPGQVKDMFLAVSEEVKGCHIFVMRMLSNVRHLEVQLLADDYGNCITVRTRDCSVQRRHQKVIEEGPVFNVPRDVITAMEQAAVRLAKAVNYQGLGTVEYMYDKDTHQFYFLELNPRIQVEHPVSELISGVNLPAALFCVGMGVPLHRIPEVRQFYGEHPYDTSPIDFINCESLPPKCHTIAVRITSENTDEGFRPTSGRVEEITFKNSKECWGYFSVNSGGEIHQFADSQFGHIFSSGSTREDARRGMVLALRNLVIRGEIHTSSAYIMELLETPEFRQCDVDTAWLDRLIAKSNTAAPSREGVYLALIAASIFRSSRRMQENTEKYISFLSAGHIPSTEYLSNYITESYVCHGIKYTVSAGRIAPSEYALSLNGSVINVPYRILKSGATQLTVGNRTYVAYIGKEPDSIRVTIGNKATTFIGDVDPTKITASVPGRLVRYLVENGAHVTEGEMFAEIEVMKMILPLRVTTSGLLRHHALPSSTIAVGSLLASITPDDPSKVNRPKDDEGPWPDELLSDHKYEHPDGVTRASRAAEGLWNKLQGYHFETVPIEKSLQSIFQNLASVFLSSVTLEKLHLSFLPEVELNQGKMQTPNEKMGIILSTVIDHYVSVESFFDQLTRQEALEKLRSSGKDQSEIFAMDFAHNQSCHHEVVKSILIYLESNHLLLKSLQPTLSRIVELQSHELGPLLLQARYLLRQCLLPSLAERKVLLAKELEEGSMENLIASSYGYDLLCSVMFDSQMPHLTQVCLEVFILREYFGDNTIKDLDIFRSGSNWYATYSFEPLEDIHHLEIDESSQQQNGLATRMGVCMVIPHYQDLRSTLEISFRKVLARCTNDATVCAIFLSVTHDYTQMSVAENCRRVLQENQEVINKYKVLETIYYVVHGVHEGPHIFTFRRSIGFREDELMRNVLPQSARRLELERLSSFDVCRCPSSYKEVHVFRATPRTRSSSKFESRLFARIVVTPHDIGVEPWTVTTEVDAGHMLSKSLAALEIVRNDATIQYPASNHIFVKMIKLTFDLRSLRHLLTSVGFSYQQRLLALGVSEVELSFPVRLACGVVPMRVVVEGPSGYGIVMKTFYESIERGLVFLHRADTSEDVAFSAMSISSDSLMEPCSTSPVSSKPFSMNHKALSKLEALQALLPSRKAVTDEASLDNRDAPEELKVPMSPYSPLNNNQVKRLQARAAGTTYCEDWISLLSFILHNNWAALCRVRGLERSSIPNQILRATQLFISEDEETLTTSRSGSSRCGMLVWIIEYAPPAYYREPSEIALGEDSTRRFVMVANDITFQSGSFSLPEDVVFRAACHLARRESIPFVYISSNSGARLGLSDEVKKRFRVAMSDKGIDYMYLTPVDYFTLLEKKVKVEVEERTVDDETRYVLTGVVGAPTEYIGVENLRGSAFIAGEMSRNYAEIPTISVVTGRSVGIGAYLNRLGRRIIQSNDSPLILTGASALNRMLGKEVYADNSQLGGKQIMVPNGVTHWNTKNDYAAARALLRWMDYVPAVTHPFRCSPRRLTALLEDPVDRDVEFAPEVDVAYDPRLLITGLPGRPGLFDHGSWTEALEGWAKSVVVGRATLGGLPCGVILVETRTTKRFNPADPADPTSSSSFVAQAGQVWFPDSARKTADALDDFHHERLPCFILANWRGFSGGMRDMFDQVLKFGASIVDNLRVYTAPVFIYIPPFGELRGGAWVVVDPVINHNGAVEMYCDWTSHGNILEPSGIAEIKFRDKDIQDLIHRNHPELAEMNPKQARDEVLRLLPTYRDVAIRFTELHDNYIRLKATGVVRDVVPWKDSRRIFHAKLLRKLKELEVANDLMEAAIVPNLAAGVKLIEERYREEHPPPPLGSGAAWGVDDKAQLEWLQQAKEKGGWCAGTDSEAAKRAHNERLGRIKTLLAQCEVEDGSMENILAELFKDPNCAKQAMTALCSNSSLSTN